MTAMPTQGALPVDWQEWQGAWGQWLYAHRGALHPTRTPFKGKNLLADHILGVWKVNGRIVELSEITFPDLTGHGGGTIRAIGLTFEDGTDVAHSFPELESALNLQEIPSHA